MMFEPLSGQFMTGCIPMSCLSIRTVIRIQLNPLYNYDLKTLKILKIDYGTAAQPVFGH